MPKTISNANSLSHSNFASPKLTDAQLSMMRAALLREDRCLAPLLSFRGAQVVKTRDKLVAAGLVREVPAKGAYPAWRRDAESGAAFALKLTAAGAKMVTAADIASQEHHGAAKNGAPRIHEESPASTPDAKSQAIAALPADQMRDRGLPRPTSKLAAVVGLLSRSEGATLADLMTATGWLPHTTRAALTGLRKRGYVVTLDRSDRVGGSLYRIDAKPGVGEEGGAKAA